MLCILFGFYLERKVWGDGSIRGGEYVGLFFFFIFWNVLGFVFLESLVVLSRFVDCVFIYGVLGVF